MIALPRFKSHLHAEAVAGEGVFLLSEEGQTVLRGRLYELVAPLIDGRRSADDIADVLDGRLPAAEVYHALMHLEKKGHLAPANGLHPDGHEAFWHIQDIDPASAAGRLATTPVTVRGLGGVEVQPLLAALGGLGVRAADEGALRVVLTDDYLRQDLEACNREALRSGRPWLLVKPVGCRIWVGPLFRPRETGCWECLAQRLHGNREAEIFVQEKTGRAEPFPVPRADTPTTRAIACNLTATEIARWIVRGSSPDLEGKVLTLDVLSWKTRTHVLVRRPQCPACGTPRQRDPAIVLQSRPKADADDGSCRSVSPAETLRRHEHHVSPITGAVTVLQRMPCPGDGVVNVYGAGHNFARRQRRLAELRAGLRAHSSGKGTTDVQARAGALCEALERYSGVFRGDEPRRTARLRDLGGAAIHPNACMQFSDRQYRERDAWNARQASWNHVPELFDEDAPAEWTPVWSLTRQDTRYLPTEFCYYDYPRERTCCVACSNGNASGNCLEEAILQGFFELVERDAVALWWYNRLPRPGVDLDSFDEPYLRRLAAVLGRQRRDLWALDLTSDLTVPTFAALSRRTGGGPEEILMGFGAHFDPRTALLRAVTELNQMLSWVLPAGEGQPPAGEMLDDPHTLAWLRTATVASQPYLAPDGRTPPRPRRSFPECRTDDIREDVLACQRLVEGKGLEMLVLDQTRPDVGLPVVKVIVPGLRHFWARFAPGRLYDAPVALGWLGAPLAEEQLNPMPMFL